MILICVNVSQANKHKRKRRTYIDAELLEELHNQHVGRGASVIIISQIRVHLLCILTLLCEFVSK